MITIGELARFAGVTVRAVRHYHARGLLPEPARDSSGYRRYGARAVVDLIRIKTLADAGVPLARVSELIAAEPEQFADAVGQIDRDLRARVRDLQRHRKQVARLAAGESLVLPAAVVDYLGRLRALGISERTVSFERDGWILLAAHSPDLVTEWVDQKREALGDAAFRDLYLAFDQAYEWSPDDPRLRELAGAMLEYAARVDPDAAEAKDGDPFQASAGPDETLTDLLEGYTTTVSPAWERLTALVEELGRST